MLVGPGTSGSITIINTGFSPSFSGGAGTFIQHATGGAANPAQWTAAGELIEVVSSKRFKTSIKRYTPDLTQFRHLRPYTFQRLTSSSISHHEVGLIAEDVDKTYPEFVNYESDEKTPKGLQYGSMVVLLTSKIQELKTRLAQIMHDKK